MARHNKSDNSSDADFEPHNHHANVKSSSSSAKKRKAGATEVKKPASLQLNQAPHSQYTTSFGGPLPTPGQTPATGTFGASGQYRSSSHRDGVVSTQNASKPTVWPPQRQVQGSLQSPFAASSGPRSQLSSQSQSSVTSALPSTPQTPASSPGQSSMLQPGDEVLNAQLHFSRRGKFGHCSRDTADLWIYILGLFFPREEGYEILLYNYREQNRDDFLDNIPSGQPVRVQLSKNGRQFHPLLRQWIVTSSAPMLSILCASSESAFNEFPAVRHHVSNDLDIPTSQGSHLQQKLAAALRLEMSEQRTRISQGRNQSPAVSQMVGAVACGTMVRFYKGKYEFVVQPEGWLKAQEKRGLDLVNGVPSCALLAVEKVLLGVKEASLKGRL